MESVSLSQLTTQIQNVIRKQFSQPVWIRAEINECRENNGHCYLELVEKSEENDSVIARSKATIWSSSYRMLKPYFEGATGESLRAGINVLAMVVVDFTGQYGFNLIVRDIDPAFTIGEIAARRIKIIRQLETDGVLDINKQLKFPELPKRIAVISSETAAGYGDFTNQLLNSPYGFAFYVKLFPAAMQGENVEKSIIQALEKIFVHAELFDVVLIIRGGGATTDLASFDSYNLALNCAQFPLPIITGIGHQRDISILDMVAHASVKTPTAAAEFLINKMSEKKIELQDLTEEIQLIVGSRTQNEIQKLDFLKYKIKQVSSTGTLQKKHKIEKLTLQLKNLIRNKLNEHQNHLRLIENKISVHSPSYLMKHGYTITLVNGKRISFLVDVKIGDKMTTYVNDGAILSTVEAKKT